MNTQWYYVSAGQQQGPVDEEQMRRMFQGGQIVANTMVWCEGMANWQPLSSSSLYASFAPHGVPQSASSSASPLATTSQASVYQAPAHQGGVASSTAPVPSYLWQSIAVTILCCLPAGIVAIVYASRVDGLNRLGDTAGALEASQKAKTWCLVSLVIGVAVTALLLIVPAAA